MISWSVSGDWTEIAPGVRVRLRDAPNEEDMHEHYRWPPDGIVILEAGTAITTKAGRRLSEADIEALSAEAERGYDISRLRKRAGSEGVP